MTKRIGHASEALLALRGAGDGLNLATDAPLVALTHATLALVEQQRIANLISLWHLGEQTGWEYAKEAPEALFKERGSLRPEIAEALGVVAK